MKSRQMLLWLGIPVLSMAMTAWAAPGDQMPMQHQQMQQERMQQMSNADIQKCAEMHGMDSSSMNMNDPAVQQMMQKCMQTMHSGQMQGGKMMGDQTQGGQMQGGMMGGQMMGGQKQGNDN